jgi:hypothetical protein
VSVLDCALAPAAGEVLPDRSLSPAQPETSTAARDAARINVFMVCPFVKVDGNCEVIIAGVEYGGITGALQP